MAGVTGGERFESTPWPHGVRHRRIALGVQDEVHVLGPADHPQFGHRLVAADRQLHARAQAGHQALMGGRVVRATGGEDGPPLVQAHLARQAEPRCTENYVFLLGE